MDKKRDFVAPASVWRRLAAFVVDMFIVEFVVLSPFTRILARLVPRGSFFEMFSQAPSSALMSAFFKVSVASSLLVIAYFFYFEYRSFQTPGKMLFGLRLVSRFKDISWWQFFVSNLIFLVYIPIVVFQLFFVYDVVYLLFSPAKQRFLERVSGLFLVQDLER